MVSIHSLLVLSFTLHDTVYDLSLDVVLPVYTHSPTNEEMFDHVITDTFVQEITAQDPQLNSILPFSPDGEVLHSTFVVHPVYVNDFLSITGFEHVKVVPHPHLPLTETVPLHSSVVSLFTLH
jgi:hypothetical protein